MSRLSIATIFVLLSLSAFAQDPRGSIAGRVEDTTGAVIPGAKRASPASTAAGMLAHATYTKPEEGEFIWGNFSLLRALGELKAKGVLRKP